MDSALICSCSPVSAALRPPWRSPPADEKSTWPLPKSCPSPIERSKPLVSFLKSGGAELPGDRGVSVHYSL